jgi:hypothetical protein
MSSTVLWRRLSATDFAAINGNASPHGRGGGAMHIALGVRTEQFAIDSFLEATGRTSALISAAVDPGQQNIAQLYFSGNPSRRGGEWRISDQYSHRHPAWSPSAGFPIRHNASDPPYIFVFKTGKRFHARFCLESEIKRMHPAAIPSGMLARSTGIASAPLTFCDRFLVPNPSRLDELQMLQEEGVEEQFNPKDISDGRKRIIASIIRRLGQRTFRRKLFSAYDGQCAITKCRTQWVLEAAHIVPYRGLKTNAVSNGLLLRADVHTLFDLALVAIEPTKVVVKVSKLLEGSIYEKLDGRSPVLPAKTTLHPSQAALKHHYEMFRP